MSGLKLGVAICTLNQLCLDFEGNLQRILKSIERSIELGASVRIGPELEVTGYGCEDAFYELDTVYHSWQVIAEIIKRDYKDILINISMPVWKDSSLFNCVLVLLNSKIVYIRPKNRLAINGNYREMRWFTAWHNGSDPSVDWFVLPPLISSLTGQVNVPFGDGAVLEIVNHGNPDHLLHSALTSFKIGYEICEELWRADAQNASLFAQHGCDLVINCSGSYWELRKLDSAVRHSTSITSRAGGVYAYVNCLGCDGGGRLVYYGRSFVVLNGHLLSMSAIKEEEIFDEIDVRVAFIDPNDVQQYRAQKSAQARSWEVRGEFLRFNARDQGKVTFEKVEGINISKIKTILIHGFNILRSSNHPTLPALKDSIHLSPEQEIQRYCCLWLWDYLRRCLSPTGIRGFIVPLSGGLDSASVACIVYCLCEMLHHQVYVRKNQAIINQLKPVIDLSKSPSSPQALCRQLLRCVYLKTKFSGADSEDRASSLANLIGAEFISHNFNDIYELIGKTVPLKVVSSVAEDEVTLQQQNVQARLRMVLTYYMSQCNRLVLATGNVDEALVGYLTKYDCSSADINPIGSISKTDLKRFVAHCKTIIAGSSVVLSRIVNATPSAELTGEEQKDEDDLGLTYEQLSLFGQTRRGQLGAYGPLGMFEKIWSDRGAAHIAQCFGGHIQADVLATKVKRFFTLYARNRHKQTVLTPALHTETYSPDDNRFDHRQFLFNTAWTWQFKQIDLKVQSLKE